MWCGGFTATPHPPTLQQKDCLSRYLFLMAWTRYGNGYVLQLILMNLRRSSGTWLRGLRAREPAMPREINEHCRFFFVNCV